MFQSVGDRTGPARNILDRNKRLCPSTLKHILFNDFNNIKFSLNIFDTSSVTRDTFERLFSAMRQLRTYARCTMVSERLSDITVIHIQFLI